MSLLFRVVALIGSGASVYILAGVIFDRIRLSLRGRRALTADQVFEDRVLSGVLLAGGALVAGVAVSIEILPLLLFVTWLLWRRMPKHLEKRRAQRVCRECESQLDVMADVVAMGLRAGLSFDTALSLYCSKFPGVLADELEVACAGWQSGMVSRERSLGDLVNSVGSKHLRRFTETVAQALKHGAPLADLLQEYADDVRRKRKVEIEQQVQKAPVRMLIPMGVCVLPSTILLVMGPAMIQFVQY